MIFVTPEIEASPRSGGTLRTHRLLSALARRATVSLLIIGSVSDAETLRASTGVDHVQVFPRLKSPWRKRAAAVSHGWPLPAARIWHPQAARWLRDRRGELVVFDHLRTAAYRSSVDRYVLSSHNYETGRLQSETPPSSPLRRAEYLWDSVTLPSFERRVVTDPRAVCVTAVSADDAQALGGNVRVVPNGADIPDTVPLRRGGGTILFVGALDYEPNREALRWWAEKIWPKLPVGCRQLRVVGRGGASALGVLASSQAFQVIGEVADVTSELADASVVVIPLQSGGGTRLKLLEAMAWARPIVTTTKGAEGLPLVPGRDVLIADDGAAFAEAVRKVLDDSVLAERLGAAGRSFVMSYDWQAIGSEFAEHVVAADERRL